MASTSYFDLSRAPSGPSMAVTSRWIDEQAVKAEARQREQEAKAEVRAAAKAEVLQRDKQIRSEVEKEMEIDRLRRKLAKKEAKERQPQLSSASHLVGAPTLSGVGPTEEILVAVLNLCTLWLSARVRDKLTCRGTTAATRVPRWRRGERPREVAQEGSTG